ncbi:DNA polymerase-4 [Limimonas halophila]|uniref:DNA polymerase IV n=1 Tax=Limimonas halophila TaxID=1082479 RepID=A0A1G7P6U2_9PROT|nr:DNA polymerase IV [Limimonas halophila]SDF81954.1 DNA polymerase-4 [Limimonas halophila]
MTPVESVCRHCLTRATGYAGGVCGQCGRRALVAHPELGDLALAHLDCDAFYASVEKRDRPELADSPLIVGGGRRGAVMACCYITRMTGVRSAMPMRRALALCPDATVIRPDMAKYREAGRHIRQLMESVTPLVEPVSIDEAYLDLSGTEALHGGPPAQTLARLVQRIEREVGVTASIGLSYAKVLAKIASGADKPRGFVAVGRGDVEDFLAPKPVSIIPGVGSSLEQALLRDGICTVGDLARHGESQLVARYGAMGRRLAQVARGLDDRPVAPGGPPKSVSAETTFDSDVAATDALLAALWPLAERVSARLKEQDRAAGSVRIKLKTRSFRVLSRSQRLDDPTKLAERLYAVAAPLVEQAAGYGPFRLVGIAAAELTDGVHADPPNLLAPERQRTAAVESAMDAVRAKLGPGAITKGRGLG